MVLSSLLSLSSHSLRPLGNIRMLVLLLTSSSSSSTSSVALSVALSSWAQHIPPGVRQTCRSECRAAAAAGRALPPSGWVAFLRIHTMQIVCRGTRTCAALACESMLRWWWWWRRQRRRRRLEGICWEGAQCFLRVRMRL